MYSSRAWMNTTIWESLFNQSLFARSSLIRCHDYISSSYLIHLHVFILCHDYSFMSFSMASVLRISVSANTFLSHLSLYNSSEQFFDTLPSNNFLQLCNLTSLWMIFLQDDASVVGVPFVWLQEYFRKGGILQARRLWRDQPAKDNLP